MLVDLWEVVGCHPFEWTVERSEVGSSATITAAL